MTLNKIFNSDPVKPIERSHDATKKVEEKKQTPSSADVTVTISDNAVNLSKIATKVNTTSEINDKKVANIKASIENGSYEINPEKIADKMIEMEKALFG